MGLTSWKGKRVKRLDTEIAQNYLTQIVLDALNKIVSAYLVIAEVRALAHEPMYMKDWLEAIDKAYEEYEKCRKKQDELLSPVEQHFGESIRELET